MKKYVEQYQDWDGGLTRPPWTDVEGWQEGNFSMTEMPGPPVPGWFRKMLLTAKHRTESETFPLVSGSVCTRFSVSVHCGDLPRIHGLRASLRHRPSSSRTLQNTVQEYNTRRIHHVKLRHTGGYRALHKWDCVETSAPLASIYQYRRARDHSPRDLSAPGLCARERVPGRGEVSRSHRRLSAGTRDRAEASPCRRPARRSGTAAARGERGAARPPNRLTCHPRAILVRDTA